MNLVYYLEINITCLIIMLFLLYARIRTSGHTSLEKAENQLIYQGILFILADIVTWVFNDVSGSAARFILYAGNMVYFISSCTILYCWLLYVNQKTGRLPSEIKRVAIVSSIPLILFGLLVFTTPITKLIFYIDAENVYHRGSLIYVHWIITFIYLITADIYAILRAQKIGSRANKNEIYRLCLFGLFPMIAAILQILIEGSTFIQTGITISLILFFTRLQNDLISTDSLTGINNRSQLDRYLIDRFYNEHSEQRIFMIMIDINDFKGINDTFGHLSGDDALKEIAVILKKVCGQYQRGLFLARYGGDEFVICGIERIGLDYQNIIESLEEALIRFNTASTLPFTLTVSIGAASGSITNLTIDELIRRADEAMYQKKKSLIQVSDQKILE